jgi:hypothetical protein
MLLLYLSPATSNEKLAECKSGYFTCDAPRPAVSSRRFNQS